MSDKFYLGIDIGATKTEATLIGAKSQVIESLVAPTIADEIPTTLQKIISHFEKKTALNGIGIAIAGQVDAKSGLLLFGPNLKKKNLPILEWVSKVTQVKAYLLNDVFSAAYAETHLGSAMDEMKAVFLFLGTGIGGAFLMDGTLHPAEIGHLTIDFRGPLCSCGNVGCLEVYASGWGLAKRGRFSSGKEAFEKGSLDLIQAAEEALMGALVGTVNLLDPKLIVLGGGLLKGYLSRNGQFLEKMETEINKRAFKTTRVVQARFTEGGPSMGAALWALSQEPRRGQCILGALDSQGPEVRQDLRE